jgi:Asp-tRNA(Asn)/Glu-tRNA(Gln) amidotransferase A subunit family amidase
MPVGMQFVAPHWDESGLISVGEEWGRAFTMRMPGVAQ